MDKEEDWYDNPLGELVKDDKFMRGLPKSVQEAARAIAQLWNIRFWYFDSAMQELAKLLVVILKVTQHEFCQRHKWYP